MNKRILTKIISFTFLIVTLFSLQAAVASDIEKAILRADRTAIENLIEKNPGLMHARYDSGDSILHLAVTLCPSDKVNEIVELLLEKGADINAKSTGGSTPLVRAVERNLYDTASLLISKGAVVNSAGSFGWTPLHSASSVNMAELLINNGADINVRLENGRTPLFRAVSIPSQKEFALFLIDRGADVTVKDRENNTLLHMVQWQFGEELPALLLLKGVDAAAANIFGETALHYAARYAPNRELLTSLFTHKLEVNVKDNEGLTPLHWAAERDNRKAAEFLISQGASTVLKDNMGKTPLYYAELGCGRDTSMLLRTIGVNENESIKAAALRRARTAIEDDDVRALKSIIGRSPYILEGKDFFRETLLHKASYDGKSDAVSWLLSRGADPDAVDKYGLTPLHYAVNADQDSIVKILCAHGADVNKKDYSGDTPLQLAAERKNRTAIRILRQYGAKE
ncbi:MAG: ankyrin repeat domain-containing protein [Vulcanimicrobiota bacterium]